MLKNGSLRKANRQTRQMDIADIQVDYEAAMLLTYRAASMKDAGLPVPLNDRQVFCHRRLPDRQKGDDIMGGYGIVNEYPVGRFYEMSSSIPPVPFPCTEIGYCRRHIKEKLNKKRWKDGPNIVACLVDPDPQYYNQITLTRLPKRLNGRIPLLLTLLIDMPLKRVENKRTTRESHSIKMAPPEAKETILEGLAMGADEAYLLSDRRFAGADTLATSYCLAQGIKKIGAIDLVLTGTESGDGATAQVSSQIGEWLGFSHLWGVLECQVKGRQDIFLKTKVENGYMEWKAELPLVLAVSREINKYRYTSIMVMKAKKKPFTIWSYDDLTLMMLMSALKVLLPSEIFIYRK